MTPDILCTGWLNDEQGLYGDSHQIVNVEQNRGYDQSILIVRSQ